MWRCFQIEVWIAIRRLIFQQRCQWSGQHKKNPNSWQIQVCGDPSPSSRWCHDLSVVCWLLTSLRSAVSPWEGGRRNTPDGKQPLPAFHIFAAWEWILFARKQSSSLKSGAKYPKKQTPSSKCAFQVTFRRMGGKKNLRGTNIRERQRLPLRVHS